MARAIETAAMLLLLWVFLGLTSPLLPAPNQSSSSCTDTLSYQVLLDKLGLSPGEIDGTSGRNLEAALKTFQREQGRTPTGRADCDTWTALTSRAGSEVLVDYAITDADLQQPLLAGPLPGSLADQAALPALGYATLLELLAERFHASPTLLTRLNPGVSLERGSRLKVPAVLPFDAAHKPTTGPEAGNVSVEVSKRRSTLRVARADGSTLFQAPVSSGSEHDPLPIGTWKVTGTSWMPTFHYNPNLFWDAEPGDEKALLKPGPNNPVGVVWVDINVPHYGMHGTPSPNLVGHAQSHGCVRLSNWDAARLASLVRPGTRVVFTE